jgi:hypothetical protein
LPRPPSAPPSVLLFARLGSSDTPNLVVARPAAAQKSTNAISGEGIPPAPDYTLSAPPDPNPNALHLSGLEIDLMNLRRMLLGLVGAVVLVAGVQIVRPASAEAATSYHIRNLAYDQCMGAPDLRLNGVLRILPCDSGAGLRRWYTERIPYMGKTYRFRIPGTQLCAEVNQNSAVPGEWVDDWTCNTTSAELWEAIPVMIGWDTYYQFKHAGTELCLDTVGSYGSQLMQWYCDTSINAAQLWKVEE